MRNIEFLVKLLDAGFTAIIEKGIADLEEKEYDELY